MKRKSLIAVALLAVSAAVLCFVLLRPGAQTAGAQVFLDGEPFSGPALSPDPDPAARKDSSRPQHQS